MSRLSRALKRLKGKPKKTKDERSQSPGGESGLTSEVITSNLKDALPCEPVLRPITLAASATTFSPVSYQSTEAKLQPEIRSAVIEYTKEAPQYELQSAPSDTKKIEDYIAVDNVSEAPTEVVQQPSLPGKTPKFTPKHPRISQSTFTAPSITSQPESEATPQVHKTTTASKPILKPAVQTHAGLYSNFTPSIAAVNHPHPRTFAEAQRAAFDVLSGNSAWAARPSGSSAPTEHQYTRHDEYDRYLEDYLYA